MPRFTTRGDWNAGVGGGVDDPATWVAAICNGQAIDPGPGGAGDWANDDEFLIARTNYTQIFAIHKNTGARRVLHTETRGLTSALWAGGGRFAYRVDGVGYFLDFGLECLPVFGFGRDGALATHAHPFNGTGLIVNGRTLSTALCWDVHVLNAEQVAWREADGPHTIGMPVPRLLPGKSYHLRVAFDGTRWWVQYQASDHNGSLVLHPFDSFDGYRLTTRGADAFRSDLMAIGKVLHTIWATVESEQLGQIAGPFLPQSESGFALVDLLKRDTDPPKKPDDDPKKPEKDPVSDTPNFAADVAQIRAHYPTPLGFLHWAFLVEVAQWTKTLLFRKEDSNSVLIPALGKRVSLDIIGRGSMGNSYADILQDSEGSARPVWQVNQPADGEYVDVSRVKLPGQIDPPPPDDPIDPPSGTLEQRVERLEARLLEFISNVRRA